MNIFDKLFERNTYKYCISCRNKHKQSDMALLCGSAGICNECYSKIKFSKYESSFEALKPIKYIISAVEYNGPILNIMRSFKFHSDFKNGEIICKILNEYLKAYPFLSEFDYVVPVPLSKQRLNERGFNQAEIIAKSISKLINVPMNTEILKRTRHTQRQSSFSAVFRYSNVEGAFESTTDLTGKSIILVDDIYTTGATLSSCGNALISAKADRIIGITFAKTLQKDQHMTLRPPSKPIIKSRSLTELKYNIKYRNR